MDFRVQISDFRKSAFSLCLGVLCALGGGYSGCTAASTKIAWDAQQRADGVDQAIVSRQADYLRKLRFQVLCYELALTAPQKAALARAWNDRDLMEFWQVQYEKSKALRVVGVDTKLWADQATIDLFFKALDAKLTGQPPGSSDLAELTQLLELLRNTAPGTHGGTGPAAGSLPSPVPTPNAAW